MDHPHSLGNPCTCSCGVYGASDRGTGTLKPIPYLEGQGDLVSVLITPITHIVTLIIPIINPLPKSP